MFKSPILTALLPSSTPGPHKSIGYAYIRSTTASRPYTLPSPKLEGEPVLKVEGSGYCLFYPCVESKGKKSVHWFPEPTEEFSKGYERFLGKQGFSWLCELEDRDGII